MRFLERVPGVNRLPAVKRAAQERADVATAQAAELDRLVKASKWADSVTDALRFAANPMIRFRDRVHSEGIVTLATIDDKPFFSVRSERAQGDPDRVQLDITLPDDYPHIPPPSDEPTSPTVIKFDTVGSRLTRYSEIGFRVAGNNSGTIRATDETPIARVSDPLHDVLRKLYLGAPEIMERAQAERGDRVLAAAFQSATPPQK